MTLGHGGQVVQYAVMVTGTVLSWLASGGKQHASHHPSSTHNFACLQPYIRYQLCKLNESINLIRGITAK